MSFFVRIIYVVATLFLLLPSALCQSITSVTAPAAMQIGETYTISWEGGNAASTSVIYVTAADVSLPVRIGSTTGNEFSWTVPAVYPPMDYKFGVSQSLLPLTGIVYGNSVELTTEPVPATSSAAASPSSSVTTALSSSSTSGRSSTISSSTSGSMRPTPVPASQTSAAQDSPSEDQGLSIGQAAGIGIGVTALVIAVAGLAFVVYRKVKKSRSSPQKEAQRTLAGGFVPRGSLGEDPENNQQAWKKESSDVDSAYARGGGRFSYEEAGDERTVGQLRVPMVHLPPSMVVRKPEPTVVRAELPASQTVHELP